MTAMNGVVTAAAADASLRPAPPDPEVPERAHRRQFSATYKLRILEEAEACSAPGEVGALLRREGLYSSHLVDWRRQRAAGTLAGLTPRRRGRPAAVAPASELARLQRENARLSRQLATAEAIIEIQKKVSTLLGLSQPRDAATEQR
jgi:transposase